MKILVQIFEDLYEKSSKIFKDLGNSCQDPQGARPDPWRSLYLSWRSLQESYEIPQDLGKILEDPHRPLTRSSQISPRSLQMVSAKNWRSLVYLYSYIEVLHGSHVGWQEQLILFPSGTNVLSNANNFHCSAIQYGRRAKPLLGWINDCNSPLICIFHTLFKLFPEPIQIFWNCKQHF